MKDLLLFRLLRAPTLDAAALLPLLDELTKHSSPANRLPYLGLVPRAVGHADPALRAAGIRALRRCDGLIAFRLLVAALADPDEEVARNAVEALRESSFQHPARFAHALFHPSEAVRRAAIAGELNSHTAAYALHLLADPACGDELRRRLDPATPEEERANPPDAGPSSLPALFELVERGHLPRAAARRLVLAMPWAEAERWLRDTQRRSPEAIAALLAAAEGASFAPDAEIDTLDALIELFWDDGEAFFRRLVPTMLGWPPAFATRAVASILAIAARSIERPWAPGAAGIVALFHPRFLAFSWVPRGARHAAIAALYTAGGNAPRIEDDEARRLVELDLCRLPSGRLDLWAIGGVLHLAQNHPHKLLLRSYDVDEVVDAFVADIPYAIPFLTLRDDSKRGRSFILDRTLEKHPIAHGLLVALLTLAAPANGLDFLDPLTAAEAVPIAIELCKLVARKAEMSGTKRAVVTRALGPKIAGDPARAGEFMRAFIDLDAPETIPIGVSLLGAIGGGLDAEPFVAAAIALDTPAILRLCALIPHCSTFPYGKELALAHALADHASPEVRGWAQERLPPPVESLPVARAEAVDKRVKRLSDAQIDAIATASAAGLAGALAPCLAEPVSGLCEALAKRLPYPANVAASTAILGSHDPMDRIDVELARFGSETPAFLKALDHEVVRVWEREPRVGTLGHAWLHRWERHAFALAEELAAQGGGLAGGLTRASLLRSAVLRASVWEGVASALAMWRWRDRPRLAELCTDALGDALLSRLASDVGEAAARAIVTIAESGVAPDLVSRMRPVVIKQLPDLDPETRQIFRLWSESRGIVGRASPRPAKSSTTPEEAQRRVGALVDLDALADVCAGEDTSLAQEAALRMIALGEAAIARLLAVIRERPPSARDLVDSIALWPEGAGLDAARAIPGDPEGRLEIRFLVAMALAERGERAFVGAAIEAACVEHDEPFFAEGDWQRLVKLGVPEGDLVITLAVAPHPHAYLRAVDHLLQRPPNAASNAAVLAFLEVGDDRSTELRYRAARRLAEQGIDAVFPVLFDQRIKETHTLGDRPLLHHATPDLVAATIDALLVGGLAAAPEKMATELLEAEIDEDSRIEAHERLLAEAMTETVRGAAVAYLTARLSHAPRRAEKLRALGRAFAWGVERGRELTGRMYKIDMIAGAGLGYTRLREHRIHVSPLPIFRGVPGGAEIVEGLILHEIGHHVYHREDGGLDAWTEAQKEGIQGLLNLVADEHLERNLRAVDASYGDRLKRLGAWAFQHADREIPVESLINGLAGRAFEVLTATRLDVARREGCVRVASGPLLHEMERAGLAFPRFFRALRMGLGDRHGDPLVREALALFKPSFRKKTMPELLDLARQLRALFGWQARMIEQFGPHETIEGGADAEVHGDGITQAEVDAEVERVLNPKKRKPGEDAGGPPGRRWINVSPDEQFELIHKVVKAARDEGSHRRYATQVALAARQMRRYLEELGLTLEPQRMRLSGRRFDRSRTLAVVVRGDPRMLIAREAKIRTDLFLGVLVDCSGSMQSHDNIEKAKLFATMLAEAARGVPGVDLRVFGFTDSVIYDAGDAVHCGAHALEAGGGNNDAAALFHAANVARQSRRRARLLVMISDGLPTECSTAALRALVTRLGARHGICCAQVAVQPLAEVCFPHYVVLEGGEAGPAVRRFGAIVAGLVRKAIAIA